MDLSEPHIKYPIVIGLATIGLCWLITNDALSRASASATPPATAATTFDELLAEIPTKEIEDLKREVEQLSMRVSREANRYSFAVFEPTSTAFQRVDTTFRTFAVSIEDLQPYGDGTRLTIKVGNPTSADHSSGKLKIRYGRKFDDKNTDDLSREIEHSIVNSIRGGAWNPNKVVLPGVKPDELAYINVQVETTQIALR